MTHFIAMIFLMGWLMLPWISGIEDSNPQSTGDPICSRNGDEDHGDVYLSVVVAGRHDNLRGMLGQRCLQS